MKASETDPTTPSSTRASATCGRPTDPSPHDAGDLLPGHGHAEVLELGDHALRARHPVVPYELALAQQLGLVGVEEVGQHVQAHAVEAAGEFGAGDERESGRQCGDGLRVPAARVVVGERDDVQTGGGRVADQLGRGVRAVGSGGVGVQIDAHARTPGSERTEGDAQG